MKPVALFTLPNCKWCKEASTYLKTKKIKFNLIDLSKNKEALKDCLYIKRNIIERIENLTEDKIMSKDLITLIQDDL